MDPRAIIHHTHLTKPVKRHQPVIHCAGHLREALVPKHNKKVVSAVVKFIREFTAGGENGLDHFDAIAARGLSGTLIAPIVAMRLNKTLLIVRKGEPTHSSRTVEGDYGATSYLMLDDFIASGTTVHEIASNISDAVPAAKCVGLVSYSRLLDEDDEERPYAERLERCFYPRKELEKYSSVIRLQDSRVIDTLAQEQSETLKRLAFDERNRRNGDSLIIDYVPASPSTYFDYVDYGWVND